MNCCWFVLSMVVACEASTGSQAVDDRVYKIRDV